MITAIDTNILLDILIPNEDFYDASANALQNAASEGPLVIGDIVYAELCIHFEGPSILQDLVFRRLLKHDRASDHAEFNFCFSQETKLFANIRRDGYLATLADLHIYKFDSVFITASKASLYTHSTRRCTH